MRKKKASAMTEAFLIVSLSDIAGNNLRCYEDQQFFLRIGVTGVSEQHADTRDIVITSYSIHYTKLYEKAS